MTVPYTFANQTGSIPLTELDANFAAVPNYANTAGTVTQPVQPNITTVGTLTNLNVASTLTTNYLYQTSTSISLGANAGNSGNIDTISIGNGAGSTNQQQNSIALGSYAAFSDQGSNSISIGRYAGSNSQGANSVAIGHNAGDITQGGNTIAIGTQAGFTAQGNGAVAIGRFAGNSYQGANSVALGRNAANLTQGTEAIAIGHSSGNLNQGNYAVAIGAFAGNNNQGANSVAIGSFAGYPTTANNAVVINGLPNALNAPDSGLYIAPVRNDDSNITNTVYYNTTTHELTYSSTGSGYGNAQVAAFLPTYSGNMVVLNTVAASGNITGNYILGNGAFLTGITTSTSNIVSGASSISIPTPSNNISVTVNSTTSATFFTSGMSLPGNVTVGNVNANYVYGNGSQLTSLPSPSRINLTVTSGTLAANAAANIIATGYKGYALYSINSNSAAWVTLYTSNAAAVSDYTRTITTDPTPGTGVVAESISNASATINFTPAVVGFNNETVTTVAIPMKIVNNGNATANISVTLTLLKMED